MTHAVTDEDHPDIPSTPWKFETKSSKRIVGVSEEEAIANVQSEVYEQAKFDAYVLKNIDKYTGGR